MTTGEVIALIKAFGGGGGGSSGGGVLMVHEEFGGTLDKTWQEINDAGLSILFIADAGWRYVAYCAGVYAKPQTQSWKVVYAYVEPDGTIYTSTYNADSADGYPVYVDA